MDLVDQDLQILLTEFIQGICSRDTLIRQLRERGINARTLADSYESLADTLSACDDNQARTVAATGLAVGRAALEVSPN